MSDKSKPDRRDTWRLEVIEKEIPILDPINKYMHWLILKFIPIAKGSRLTPEQVGKMIIGDNITKQKKKFLLKCYTIGKLY